MTRLPVLVADEASFDGVARRLAQIRLMAASAAGDVSERADA